MALLVPLKSVANNDHIFNDRTRELQQITGVVPEYTSIGLVRCLISGDTQRVSSLVQSPINVTLTS